jgi:hypothetical protein
MDCTQSAKLMPGRRMQGAYGGRPDVNETQDGQARDQFRGRGDRQALVRREDAVHLFEDLVALRVVDAQAHAGEMLLVEGRPGREVDGFEGLRNRRGITAADSQQGEHQDADDARKSARAPTG